MRARDQRFVLAHHARDVAPLTRAGKCSGLPSWSSNDDLHRLELEQAAPRRSRKARCRAPGSSGSGLRRLAGGPRLRQPVLGRSRPVARYELAGVRLAPAEVATMTHPVADLDPPAASSACALIRSSEARPVAPPVVGWPGQDEVVPGHFSPADVLGRGTLLRDRRGAAPYRQDKGSGLPGFPAGPRVLVRGLMIGTMPRTPGSYSQKTIKWPGSGAPRASAAPSFEAPAREGARDSRGVSRGP